jgi:hypothetical protein
MQRFKPGVWIVFGLIIFLTNLCLAGPDIKVNKDTDLSVQNEPSITINPHFTGDLLNVVAAYNDIGNTLGISYSPDSGITWFDVQLPAKWAVHGDPSIAADLSGNLYACFLSYQSTVTFYDTSGIYVCKSVDGGRSWSPPVTVDQQLYTGGSPVYFADKCMMTVDTNSGSPYVNNIYVGWQRDFTDGAHSDIYFAYSTNGGAGFSTPMKINDNTLGSAFCEGAFPFVGADGDVYMTWYDSYFQGHEPGSLYVDKSTNGGMSFGTDIKVSNFLAPPKYTHSNTGFKAKSFPCGAGDPFFADTLYITYIGDPDGYFDRRISNGKVPGVPPGGGSPSDWPVVNRNGNYVYVAYRDNRNGAQDIYFNRSTDNGVTWETPDIGRLDNGDTPGANNSSQQRLSSSGSYVYCVWVDYRVASTSHIFFNYSTDNGLTWQTDKQIDGGGGASTGDPVIASTGNYVYVAWLDNRNGLGDIYFSYSSNNGAFWSVPQRIDLGDTPGSAHSFNPRLACVGNNVYCMWGDQRGTGLNQIYFNYSTNNGQNWIATSQLISQPLGQNCYVPVKGGLEATGSYVYACWEDDRINPGSAVNAIYFNRSISSGTTWGTDVQISDSSYYCSMPHMVIENNNVYIGWEDNRLTGTVGIYDMFFDYSTDNGLTWQVPDVGPLDAGGVGIASDAIELAADGNYVYATWYDTRFWGGMAGDVFFCRSSNNGASWSADIMLNDGTRPVGLQFNLPVISADNGYVNVFWPDPRVWGIPQVYTNYSSDNGATWLSGPDEADVYLVHSYDGGSTWSSPVTVNDDGSTYAQVLPWVLVKSNSFVDVTYYNFRFTPINPQFPGAELRLAVSTNFGAAFMPSFPIQDTVVMPMTDWVGEYNGMASLDTMLYTVFTDNQQTGNSDIFLDRSPNPSTGGCQGRCGDPNQDGSCNVSDAVYIINYVFITGAIGPQPVLACGDANGDGGVNVSDAVYIINYVFVVGSSQPGNCSPGSPNWYNGDCCPY